MLAVFGIESDGLNLAVNLLILFLVVLWAALVYWTYADARRRIADPLLIGCAAAAAFIFPFVGAIVYMIVRPPEFLDDVRERELEIKAIETRLGGPEFRCGVCGCAVEPDYLVCPVCTTKLRQACSNCGKPLEPAWQVCPYCETPAGVEPVSLADNPRRPRSTRSHG